MRVLTATILAAVLMMACGRGGAATTAGAPEMKNLEHGTSAFWKDVKFTPDTTDPSGKRGKWSGWFHQDVVDASKLKDGVIRARIDGQWQDLKVVTLPEDFQKWNFARRLAQLAEYRALLTSNEMKMPTLSGPHNGIVASHGTKRKDSEFDINNAVKGMGWLPKPEKLAELTELLKKTWNDSLPAKLATLESLYKKGAEYFDLSKQSSLELYSQPNFETHTFLNQMVDPGVAVVFLDLPKSYELRCIAQMIHPDDPGLSEYEKGVVEYINLVHDYFHGQMPRKSIGVIYHVVQVFDNSPGMMRGQRIVPLLPSAGFAGNTGRVDNSRPVTILDTMPENTQLQIAPKALPVPDVELVKRVQAGNTEAFEELVRRYERKVYNITYRLMGNEQDASEALQDTFLRAYRFIGKFQFKSAFFTWLYRIATNVSLSKLRRREKVDMVSIDEPLNEAGDLPLEIPDFKYNPEKMMKQRELRDALQTAVDELPADYRSVVVLRDLEGLSNEEVSRILNLSVPAVKSRLHRGRLVLRGKLAHYL